MQGFETRFKNLPDYILQCTAQIWEGRDIAALNWHYGDDLIVRTPAGISVGNAAGKAATMATLTEFPDRQLLGQDVIWCGNDRDGFLSSHRILSTATHHGGAFGPAKGRKLQFMTIADTFCRKNRVWDEWLIRDNAAIAIQLGTDARTMARDQILTGNSPKPLTPKTDIKGPYTGLGNDDAWGEAHADILHRIMQGDLAVIPEQYDRACHLHYPGGVAAHGTAAADAFWLGLRASFPSARFKVAHQIGRADKDSAPRSAIRWSLTGQHDGWGRYGAPTGADVHVMGVSHVEFGPWGLRRETTLLDDIAIHKQILLHTGEYDARADI